MVPWDGGAIRVKIQSVCLRAKKRCCKIWQDAEGTYRGPRAGDLQGCDAAGMQRFLPGCTEAWAAWLWLFEAPTSTYSMALRTKAKLGCSSIWGSISLIVPLSIFHLFIKHLLRLFSETCSLLAAGTALGRISWGRMARESHWWNGQKKCAVGSISPWHLGRDLIWPRRQVYTGTLS